MKRGFTLLEILIVIIIIAVLATLGLNQYMSTVERARGAEVKQVIGHLRSMCAAFYMEDGSTGRCDGANLTIGSGLQDIPGQVAANCKGTHFFWYQVANNGAGIATFTATRCIAGSNGKSPWNAANFVRLGVDYAAGGQDTWTNAFGY